MPVSEMASCERRGRDLDECLSENRAVAKRTCEHHRRMWVSLDDVMSNECKCRKRRKSNNKMRPQKAARSKLMEPALALVVVVVVVVDIDVGRVTKREWINCFRWGKEFGGRSESVVDSDQQKSCYGSTERVVCVGVSEGGG